MEITAASQYYGRQGAHLEWSVPEGDAAIGANGYYLVSLDDYRLALKTVSSHLDTVDIAADSEHSFQVEAYDAHGTLRDSSASVSFYTTDYIAPAAGDFSVAQLPNGEGFRFTFSGYSDNAGIDVYVISVNGEEDAWITAPELEADGSGGESAATNLNIDEPGQYTISVVAMDADGNESRTVTHTIDVVEMDAPDEFGGLDITLNPEKYTATLSWEKSDDASGPVRYEVVLTSYDEDYEAVTQTFQTSSTQLTTPVLAAGGYDVTVTAYDQHGNYTECLDSTSFVLEDVTAPVAGGFTVVQLPNGDGFRFTFTGYSDNVAIETLVVSVDGEEDYWFSMDELEAGEKGALVGTASLSCYEPGGYSISVVAMDANGNESAKVSRRITATETDGPDFYGYDEAEQNDRQYTATITWEAATDDSGGISYEIQLIGYDADGEATVQTFKTKSTKFTTPALAIGSYDFTLTAYDKHGNYTVAGGGSFDIVDVTAPTAGAFTLTQTSCDFSVDVSWNAFKDNVGVSYYDIYVDGEYAASVGADETTADGAYCATVWPYESEIGTNVSVYLIAVDNEGNECTTSTKKIRLHEADGPTEVGNLQGAQQGTANAVALSWTAATDSAGIAGYRVAVEGDWDNALFVKGCSCTVTGLAYNYESMFTVVAVDSNGNDGDEADVSVFVEDVVAPTAGEVSVVQEGGELVVAISGFTDNDQVFTYDVFLDGRNVAWVSACDDEGYQLPTTVVRLDLDENDIGADHEILVKASDETGNESAAVVRHAAVVAWNDDDEPGIGVEPSESDVLVGNLSAEVDGGRALLTWEAPETEEAIVGYRVYVDHGLELSEWQRYDEESGEDVSCWTHEGGLATQATTLAVDELAAGGHYFWVEAQLASGEWIDSGYAFAFDVADTVAPVAGTFDARQAENGYGLELSWSGFTDNLAIAGYRVQYGGAELELEPWETEVSLWCYDEQDVGRSVSVSIQALDYAGNVSGQLVRSVTIAEVEESEISVGEDEAEIAWTQLIRTNDGYVTPQYYYVYLDDSDTPIRVDSPNYHIAVTSEKSITSYRVLGVSANGEIIGEAASGRIVTQKKAEEEEPPEDPTEDPTDETAPTAGVVSAAQEAGGYGVAVAWSGFSDNVGVASYKVVVDGVEKTLLVSDLTADASGIYRWRAEADAEHAGGRITVSVQALDAAGNSSREVTTWCELADVTAPDAISEVSGQQIAGQGVYEFSWQAPHDNGGGIAAYIVTIDGVAHETAETFFRTDALAVGEHEISVVARDLAGNMDAGNACVQKFQVADFTAPEQGSIGLARGEGDYGVNILIGGFTDNEAVDGYNLYVDGVLYRHVTLDELETGTHAVRLESVRTTARMSSSRTESGWLVEEFSPALAGRHTIGVSAVDAAGNESAVVWKYVTRRDVTAPDAVTGIAASEKDDDGQVVISWNCGHDNTDGAVAGSGISHYLVSIDGSEWRRCATTSLVCDSLADGEHAVQVVAVDQVGNASVASDTLAFTVGEIPDTTAPLAGIASLEQVADDKVRLAWSGFADDIGVAAYRINCDGIYEVLLTVDELEANDAGAFSWTLNVGADKAGEWIHVAIQALDAAGNASQMVTAQCQMDVPDVTAPTQGSVALEQASDSCNVTISWQGFTDDVGIVSYIVTIAGEEHEFALCELEADASGKCQWCAVIADDQAGQWLDVSVRALDAAGNASTDATARCLLRDVTPPDTVADAEFSQTKGAGIANFAWEAPDDNCGVVRYAVTIDGVAHDTESPAFTTDVLAVGTHEISIRAFDAAGNGSLLAYERSFEIQDYTAPVAGTVWLGRGENAGEIIVKVCKFRDDTAIVGYNVYADGAEPLFVGMEDLTLYAQDRWRFTACIPETLTGLQAIGVSAVDAAGNESGIVTRCVRMPGTAVQNL